MIKLDFIIIPIVLLGLFLLPQLFSFDLDVIWPIWPHVPLWLGVGYLIFRIIHKIFKRKKVKELNQN